MDDAANASKRRDAEMRETLFVRPVGGADENRSSEEDQESCGPDSSHARLPFKPAHSGRSPVCRGYNIQQGPAQPFPWAAL